MYDEPVLVTLKRDGETKRQTITCAVFTDQTGDAYASGSMDTEREDIGVNCRKSDWAFVSQLRRGDRLERPFVNKTYCVSEVVRDSLAGLVIRAREARGK